MSSAASSSDPPGGKSKGKGKTKGRDRLFQQIAKQQKVIHQARVEVEAAIAASDLAEQLVKESATALYHQELTALEAKKACLPDDARRP